MWRGLFFLTVALVWLLSAQPSFAAGENINAFSDQVTLHDDGSATVRETIVYDFDSTPHHGIFRTIPLTSKVGNLYRTMSLSISQVLMDDSAEQYTTTDTNGSELIKIGDPNQTMTGAHTYQLTYTVKNVIGNYSDHDEFYWNVTGSDWTVPINQASITLSTDFATSITNAKCFTGEHGSTSQSCQVRSGNFTTIRSNTLLNPGEELTVVLAFPPHTFPPSTLVQAPQNIDMVALIIIIIGLFYYMALPPSLLIWYLKHKHKNRFGKVVVNFDIPKDQEGNRLPPAEAGTVDATKLDKNDIIATIFDLAIRKYLKITEVETDKKLLGVSISSKSYSLQKLTDDVGRLNEYERRLFKWIFSNGKTVNIASLKHHPQSIFRHIEKLVFASLVNRGLFVKNPNVQRRVLLYLLCLSLSTLNILLAPTSFYLYKVLNGRTQQGDLVDWKLDGLKLFLKNMSREYKWQANELITVEKMIPYAIALGYIDKFMDQLKLSYPNYNPYWYSGNSPFFYNSAVLFSSMHSSFATVAPATSSGFSGGGFAGGGGGGGGGGAW